MIKSIKEKHFISCILAGALSGLAFAPTFLLPLVLCLGLLSYHISISNSFKKAALLGFCFGVSHFVISLHWISFAVLLYAKELWWLLPFSIFGLPCVIAIFISLSAGMAYFFKESRYYDLYFAASWTFCEWLRSWLFTGFPWNQLGYSLSFSTILVQGASIFGVLGLSLIIAYIASGVRYLLSDKVLLIRHTIISFIIFALMTFLGLARLNYFSEIGNTDLSIRVVQANIQHQGQLSINQFIDNLKTHIDLSEDHGSLLHPKLIIWPESSVPTFINNQDLLNIISSFLTPEQTLITGSVNKDDQSEYVGMYGINYLGQIIFSYNKIHLVPFGEYLPLRNKLPEIISKKLSKMLEKIIDLNYSKGYMGKSIKVDNLSIRPLICYESIFPHEVRTKDADLILNITNGNWFGHSAGPYQHFYITAMRAVENGIPVIVNANNGISAIIDPVGRILKQTKINTKTYLDGYVPNKLKFSTLYTSYHEMITIGFLIFVLSTLELIKKRNNT
ncbi:hypothetical protein phytr_9690 [Candidatus Phycorickettsia trachydisci]|uniref:Apolipoprotein N-acyltransferase n=1 Tax=Candidatus Phycorickettsia trachydisci TaxID=2115978 RepID=A0A2P1P9F7_9RICK|nr:apolipoprotein N-acyltransferase [Candidatus Phycorickettsia trachydisci]AVP87897.1 hypothetical protein phytr_9690 [Candidatus Phycorickettsia trachydisci]